VPQDSETLNLEHALGVLRRRAWLIALCVVLAGAAAYGFSKRETRKYTATAAVVFSENSLSQQIAGLSVNSNNSATLQAQQASDLELVKRGDTAEKTAHLIGHGLTAENVAGSLNIAAQGESGIVSLAATATSPVIAALIANTYGRQFVGEQQSADRHYIKSALALVRKQLAAMSPSQRTGTDGVELQNRAQTLGLLAELGYGNVRLTQEAAVPTSPSSPRTSRNTGIGLVLGLLVGLAFAFALERFDRRIRDPEDLQTIYRLPLLGVIPQSSALARPVRHDARGSRSALPPAQAEAFSLIRAHLRFFNIDRDLRTLVVASAVQGEGKTTIARHLADAAARLGSRVLLLELDLRHPTLAQQLNIESGPGISGVLIGNASMDDAIQSVTLEPPPGEGAQGRTLDVLVAGMLLPPNPGELLESRAMEAVLAQAKFAYDLVVIDTPPLAAVSDAFPLLTKVDGVVLVGWVGHSRRDAAEELHRVLASSGAPLLGVVANGSKTGGPAQYGYSSSGKASPIIAPSDAAAPSVELVRAAKV
jgi:succinoglycan biosynthesis transport protein ExoP